MVLANSFGLSTKFLFAKKKSSMLPQEIKEMKKQNIQLAPEVKPSELHEKFEEWIDPRYVVIFAEDGTELNKAKSFRFNLLDIMTKYEASETSPRGSFGNLPSTKSSNKVHLGENEMSRKFQKRAYKELLEFCA